jgi:hypothetical protein
MYTGTLIRDLIVAVERAEQTPKHIAATPAEQWQWLPAYELPAADLLGVA